MSDNAETNGEGKQSGKTLNLKRTVESGPVRQSFSHGRSRSVVVEKRRRRTIKSDEAAAPAQEEAAPAPKLSKNQQAARQSAVADAKIRAEREAKQAEEDARRRAEEDARRAAEEAKRRAAQAREEKKRDKSAAPTEPTAPPAAPRRDGGEKRAEETRPSPAKRTQERRRRTGKLTINNALNDEERQRSLASIRRRREREKRQLTGGEQTEKVARTVIIPDAITIQELANRMAERAVDVIKSLMQQGMMAKINDTIDADTAQLIAEELGHTVKRVSEADVEEGVIGADDSETDKKPRPPVVTVMGHVDHGKTSLLDALRKTTIVSGEAGGITQHIGAYQTDMAGGGRVTLIDTPGHAAFTAMRARGAKVTDIVILVVAGDDGVMPQTIEAIEHAKAAQAPIIVAINKMDKEEADAERVRNELLKYEIIGEKMGGDTQMIEISAQSGDGLDNLLEAVALQAELMELKANPDRPGEGIVIEARLDRGRGPMASVLLQRGTLRVGDIFVAGSVSGRVRALVDDRGEKRDMAGPSEPIEILGATAAPRAGDMFNVVENEARAREVAEYRARKARETAAPNARGSLDQMFQQLQSGAAQEMAVLVKADVQGSAEAIAQAIEGLGNDEISARVIHAGVGGITESDVTLAAASAAPVIGFNVRANAQARTAAEQAGIEIRYYSVIYDLVDDMKAAMSGLLKPDLRENKLGNAEILEVFSIGKKGRAAGCRVSDGLVRLGAHVRLIRDDVVMHEGVVNELRRFKDDVKEVNAGQECGMAFEGYIDFKAGDVIECYEVEEITRTLDDA